MIPENCRISRSMVGKITFLALLSASLGAWVMGVKGPSRVEAAPAQTDADTLSSQLAALRDAALTDDYAYRELAHLTENIGPRGLGSPQAEAAAQYVASEMRKLGLDAKLEPVHVPKWTRGVETGELVEY